MLGGLSTQGGFMGNAGGLASKFPFGVVGEIGGLNSEIADQMKLDQSMGLAGAVAANPFGGVVGSLGLGGGTQMGNAGGLNMGIAGSLIDPMTIKKVF